MKTIKVGNRKLQDLIEEINFFPNNIKEIHLGETNINTTEGEITEYPYFKELILAIKEKRPNAHITLTTGGNNLTNEIITFLKQNNISLVVSLHSIDPVVRAKITGNTLERANIAINGFKQCIQENIDISVVRLVPMDFMPDEDIYNTLKFLIESNINEVHIWVASFSKFTKNKTILNLKKECDRILNIIKSLESIFNTSKTFTKIYLRPFSNFNCIQNIRKNSYAENIGLQINDEIIKINNIQMVNGSHTIHFLKNNIIIDELLIKRNHQLIILKNVHGPMIANNIFIDCSIGYDIIKSIASLVKEDLTHSLVITSEASYEAICNALNKKGLLFEDYHITCAKNQTFGGNICVNGLITVDDFLLTLNEYRKNHKNSHITKIIIAKDNFITGEKDVANRPLQDLRTEGCVDVILV